MALSSVVRPISAGTAGGPTRTGAVWLKFCRPADGSPSNHVALAKAASAYSVTNIGGNATSLRINVGVLPGGTGEVPVITAYAVPGAFTPTSENPYPTGGSPVTLTGGTVQGNDDQLDHLHFTGVLPIGFSGGQAQVVILSNTGGYAVVRYDQETLPQLTTATITSSYPGSNTGFTSGNAINISFSSSGPVSQIAVWPHDAVLDVDGVPTGTPQYVTVAPAASSGTISVTLAAISATAYAAAGKLYVAARQYGQISTPVQTTGTHVFDERSPSFSGAVAGYTYPATQSAIKASEQCTVGVTGVTTTGGGTLTGTVAANFSATNRLAPVGSPPFAVTAGASSFAVQRGASGFNGRAYLTLTATNSNNGKTASSSGTFVGVDVQDTAFSSPVLTVNGGSPISTAVGGTAVTVSISSVVETINPTGHVTLPQVSLGTWATADGGYTWTCTGTVADTAVRNPAYAASLSTYLTAAGSTISALTGTYKISGFQERAFVVSPAFATDVNLGSLPVDYSAGLVVKNLAFVPTTFTYVSLGNKVVLTDAALVEMNTSGTMPVYISQAASP
jgi:hypothetical protein